tara:strand:- start:383 stop:541 length:159 start_codon:yes stop_codon:yes gene_type:complete
MKNKNMQITITLDQSRVKDDSVTVQDEIISWMSDLGFEILEIDVKLVGECEE